MKFQLILFSDNSQAFYANTEDQNSVEAETGSIPLTTEEATLLLTIFQMEEVDIPKGINNAAHVYECQHPKFQSY